MIELTTSTVYRSLHPYFTIDRNNIVITLMSVMLKDTDNANNARNADGANVHTVSKCQSPL